MHQVLSVIRRRVASGALNAQQANDAVDDLRADMEIDLEDTPSTAPQIRAPGGSRVSAAGDDYLNEPAPELVELDVPDEDDYLDPGRGGEQ